LLLLRLMRKVSISAFGIMTANSEGMFLYVKVILSCLQDLNDLTEIRNEIEALPKNFHDA
jgi:hypothetical protein